VDGAASREWGGGIINHGWDFIKLRLSCAQCIVYYLLLRGGFAQLGNTPGTVFCFELAFALPSRSPWWSCRERCHVCRTLAVFPKIESHRAKRVSNTPHRPTPVRLSTSTKYWGGNSAYGLDRQRVARGKLWGLISGDVEPFPHRDSCLCSWVSRVTRDCDITWIHCAIPLTAGYRDDLLEHAEIMFKGRVSPNTVHQAFVLKRMSQTTSRWT